MLELPLFAVGCRSVEWLVWWWTMRSASVLHRWDWAIRIQSTVIQSMILSSSPIATIYISLLLFLRLLYNNGMYNNTRISSTFLNSNIFRCSPSPHLRNNSYWDLTSSVISVSQQVKGTRPVGFRGHCTCTFNTEDISWFANMCKHQINIFSLIRTYQLRWVISS